MIYQRRPEFVQAIRYEDKTSVLEDIAEMTGAALHTDYCEGYPLLQVHTEWGFFLLAPGDYICQDQRGHLFWSDREKFKQYFLTV